ncbi:MAG: HlyC/CorC family transporter [Lachnospiraceae bacterium]|nr:HlyC/CorC family transporter [Lachnospiraceae bacterium]
MDPSSTLPSTLSLAAAAAALDTVGTVQLVCAVLLLFLSAFFSSAETALTTCSKIRMRSLAEEGNARAQLVLDMTDQPDKMLSAILIGNNLVNLSASALVTTLTIRLFGNPYVGAATGVVTLFVLIFGEITPKTAAANDPDKLALRYARPIRALMTVLTPAIFLVNLLARGFMLLLRIDPDKRPGAITEDEFRTIVDVSQEEGVLEDEEREMINNVVDFGETEAKDVMIPRVNMVFVSEDASYREVLEVFRAEMFTRLPVYRGTTDTVIGILNMKDLLLYEPDKHEFRMQDFLREAYFTYEFKKTSDLFLEMRRGSISMAIVLDEYGDTAGLVTMEDLLEEIVGEIRDEYDESEHEVLQKLGDRVWRVDGSMHLDDLNDALGLELESEDFDSIGGLVIGLLGHLPEEGEEVKENGITYRVDVVRDNRIEWVRVTLPEPEAEAEKPEE